MSPALRVHEVGLTGPTSAMPTLGACDHAPLWCEENVARFLSRPAIEGLMSWALIISNPRRSVALTNQRAGRQGDGLVLWDYHVVALVAWPGLGPLLFDLDSRLDFPLPAMDWLHGSLPAAVAPSQACLIRIVPAAEYVGGLSSDRSHMRLADGGWQAPPPSWEPFGGGSPPNLMEWIDMGRVLPGRVVDRAGLASFFADPSAGRWPA